MQLEDAYQEALQHSLAIQAELLREEIADLQASQKPSTSSKKKRNKEKKKKKKKEAAAAAAASSSKASKSSQKVPTKQPKAAQETKKRELETKAAENLLRGEDDEDLSDEFDPDGRVPEEEEIDREVEEFRLLLEKINTESNMRKRKKLVLPPGAFANMASVGSC